MTVDDTHKTYGLKPRAGLVLGPLLACVVYLMPMPRLTTEAHTLAALLSWVVVFWITEALPLPVTSLLGASFCVMAGLASMKTVFAAFAHPIIFLFIGSFFIAEAFVVHHVDRRFATWIISSSWAAGRPGRIFFLLGATTAIISMWMSNTAAVAILLPIALGVLSRLRVNPTSFAAHDSGAMLLLAYSAAVGGVMTIIGTPPNLIGVGLLAEQAGTRISFLTWMAIGVPVGLVMYVVIFRMLFWLHPVSMTAAQSMGSTTSLTAAPGPWTRGQVNACLSLGFAIVLWILPGLLAASLGPAHGWVTWLNTHMPKELVAVLAGGLLFLLPVDFKRGEFSLTWKHAANINWGTILLFGGGLTFGHLMETTGLAGTLGTVMVDIFGGDSLWGLTAVSIATGLILTELASNTASASILVPVVIAIAKAAALSAIPPVMGVCMAASLAFVLPVSTPPNAIVYGTGLIPLLHMIRAGIVLDVVGGCVIWLMLRTLCPLFGMT